MRNRSRLENSLKNSAIGIAAQLVDTVLGLVVRTVFIRSLSAAYLGINGLFSNILTMLSLAEMGVGAAILYHIYKPLAEDDEIQVARLMNLYRHAYTAIGCVVAIVGLSITPFLGFIISDKPDVPHLTFIYLLYLANTVSSYFFAYRRSIFTADQRERVIKVFNMVTYLVKAGVQIAILVIWHSFIAYLTIQIICTFMENVVISLYADKCYPYLKKYRNEQLQKKEKDSIFTNIKATFIYKFCSVILNGTDNIIISAVNGVTSVGLLSNYSLLTNSVQSFLNILTHSVTGSIGNYIAKEKAEKHEQLLINATFVNFLLYGVVFVGSVAILNPFIEIWAGSDYLLSMSIVVVHCLNLFISGTLSTVWTFRSTMGLFIYGKWRPLFSAVINLVVSIWWGRAFGLIGVLLGTTFTRAVTNLWYDPLIVYKHGLKKKPTGYFLRWISYAAVVSVDISCIILLQKILNLGGIIAVLVYGCCAVLVFALSAIAVYHNTDEFRYVQNIGKRLLKKVIHK